jgi:hypothetical protein
VEEKSRARRRTTPPKPHEEEDDATPELHPAGVPYDDIDAAALPARPRPTGFDPPPHRALPPSAPPVRIAVAAPFLSPVLPA